MSNPAGLSFKKYFIYFFHFSFGFSYIKRFFALLLLAITVFNTQAVQADITESPVFVKSFPNGIDLNNSVEINGTLFFVGDAGVYGRELWKSDGTEAGTVLVKDINSGLAGSYPDNLTDVNGTLFFSALDSAHRTELWKSDGTFEGTVLVKDIYSGAFDSYPKHFSSLNGILYFQANDGVTGQELWRSDGTEAGTFLVRENRNWSIGPIQPGPATELNGALYFIAYDYVNGHTKGFWKSDGTEAGTVKIMDTDLSFSNVINIDGMLFFISSPGGHELWKTDGTVAGTVLVKDFGEVVGPPIQGLVDLNGTLFFKPNGFDLWKTDGTEAGTILVKSLVNSGAPVAVNDVLFFDADSAGHGSELWKSDGTEAGTVLVKDINSGIEGSSPVFLADINGTLFFQADNGISGKELWKSNGTEAGTVLVEDINNGLGDSYPGDFIYFDGTLFFEANDGANNDGLWRLGNPTPTTPQISSPTSGSTLSGTDQVFSWVTNNANVQQWWLFAGSAVGGFDYAIVGGDGTSTSAQVTGLPIDGSPVYIRMWFQIDGDWVKLDETYTAANTNPEITSPLPGTTLSGTNQVFSWITNGANVQQWWLYAGSAVGGFDYAIVGGDGTSTSAQVTGLPSDGSPVYIRMWFQIDGDWVKLDETYTAANTTPEITSPLPGASLLGSSQVFNWTTNEANVDQWWFYAGSTVEGFDYAFVGGDGTSTTALVSNLPLDGSTIFITIWYQVAGSWVKVEAVYTAYDINGGPSRQ